MKKSVQVWLEEKEAEKLARVAKLSRRSRGSFMAVASLEAADKILGTGVVHV